MTASNLSPDVREKYVAQATELMQWLESQALPALPQHASEILRHIPIWISAERIPCPESGAGHACAVGETHAPGDGEAEYKITLSLELFLNPDSRRILAHEIFHVVQHALDPSAESWTENRRAELGWFREGLAQFFEYRVSGSPNAANMREAFEGMNTALTARYDPHGVTAENYGHDFLYFFYLWRECGGDGLIKKFTHEKISQAPELAINQALSDMHLDKAQCRDFSSSALHFELARVMNHKEDGTREENRHLLWPSRYARNYIQPTGDLASLRTLEAFKPVVISGGWIPEAPLPEGLTRTWIHLSLPYRAQLEPPAALDTSWVQVLVRVRAPSR